MRLLDDLRRGRPRPAYLLHGTESWLIGRVLEALRGRLLGEGGAGTWRTLWGGDDDVAAALDDLQSPPLFGGPQVVVVRRAEQMGEGAQARVLEVLPALGAGGSLVLVAQDASKIRKLAAAIAKAGAVVALPALGERDLRAAMPWVTLMAREAGHDIAPAAVTELLERSGTSLGVLAGEIAKLAVVAAPGGRIDVEHVRRVVPASRAHDAFELTARLANGDAPGASRLLRRILSEGEPPVRLLAFLAANLRTALHIAELKERGIGNEEIGRRTNLQTWLVPKRQWKTGARGLLRTLLVLRRLDLELKSSVPPEAAFEAALLEIATFSSPRT